MQNSSAYRILLFQVGTTRLYGVIYIYIDCIELNNNVFNIKERKAMILEKKLTKILSLRISTRFLSWLIKLQNIVD